WTVANPDLALFVNGTRLLHQCMLVELKSTASPGLTFTSSSVYRNMDVVSASRFQRDALLSVKGLAPAAGGSRDLYVYVETRDMPERVKHAPAKEPIAVSPQDGGRREVDRPDQAGAARPLPAYRVHIYHDTGKV